MLVLLRPASPGHGALHGARFRRFPSRERAPAGDSTESRQMGPPRPGLVGEQCERRERLARRVPANGRGLIGRYHPPRYSPGWWAGPVVAGRHGGDSPKAASSGRAGASRHRIPHVQEEHADGMPSGPGCAVRTGSRRVRPHRYKPRRARPATAASTASSTRAPRRWTPPAFAGVNTSHPPPRAGEPGRFRWTNGGQSWPAWYRGGNAPATGARRRATDYQFLPLLLNCQYGGGGPPARRGDGAGGERRGCDGRSG